MVVVVAGRDGALEGRARLVTQSRLPTSRLAAPSPHTLSFDTVCDLDLHDGDAINRIAQS